jgi:hypothetical protein
MFTTFGYFNITLFFDIFQISMNVQPTHIPVMQMQIVMTRMDHSLVPVGQVTLAME